MEGRVVIVIGYVDDVTEDVWGDGFKSGYVVFYYGWNGWFLIGYAELFVLEGV